MNKLLGLGEIICNVCTNKFINYYENYYDELTTPGSEVYESVVRGFISWGWCKADSTTCAVAKLIFLKINGKSGPNFESNLMKIINNKKPVSRKDFDKLCEIAFDLIKKCSSKNFRYLDELIHGSDKEINLDSDIILSDDEESKYLDGIKLDVNDIIINGNGHAIDACGKTRIFKITGENIKIKNISLENGFSQKGGGAIANAGILSIADATFSHNNVNGDGGAIYNDMFAKISITNTSFIKNKTNEDGGAIFNWGELKIENSIFQENFAKTDASAIHNGGGIHNFSVAESKSGDGIASKNNLEHGNLYIIGTDFIKNTAESTGTIVNWNEVKIENSTFRQNDAKDGSAVIWNYGNYVTFNNVLMSDNHSGRSGTIINKRGEMNVLYCKIHNNKADTIIANHKNSGLRIYNCEFINNSPRESVIDNMGKSCFIGFGFFDDNSSRLINNYSKLIISGFAIKNDDEIIFNKGHIIIKKNVL